MTPCRPWCVTLTLAPISEGLACWMYDNFGWYNIGSFCSVNGFLTLSGAFASRVVLVYKDVEMAYTLVGLTAGMTVVLYMWWFCTAKVVHEWPWSDFFTWNMGTWGMAPYDKGPPISATPKYSSLHELHED